MDLYGVYGSHTTDACPLFNQENRELLIAAAEKIEKRAPDFGIQVKAAYHSGLEHTFVWIVGANNAHSIEDLMIDTQVAKFNAMKIVPLRTLDDVVASCKAR